MSIFGTALLGLYMGASSFVTPSHDAFDVYRNAQKHNDPTEWADFYRATDNLGHEGIVIEVRYRSRDSPETNVDAISEAKRALKCRLGLKKNPRTRMQVLDEWDNGDGTCSAKILASDPLRKKESKTFYGLLDCLEGAYYFE